MTATLVQVSDTHLAAVGSADEPATRAVRRDRADRAWEWFTEQMRADPPDLIVHTGDLVLDDPDRCDDRSAARAALARLEPPVRVVPGNHDVGDRPNRSGLPHGWLGPAVSAARLANWQATWGPGHWAQPVGGWTVLGITSSLLGTGLAGEREQWRRLHERLRHAPGPCALFLHESPDPGLTGLRTDSWAAVPAGAQRRLRRLVDEHDVRVVGYGHAHRFHHGRRGRAHYVSAPALAGPIPDHPELTQPAGDPAPGFLRYDLSTDDVTLRPVRIPDAVLPHTYPHT